MNCLIIDNDSDSAKTLKEYVRKSTAFNVTYSCSSTVEATNILESQGENIDVIFFKIDKPSEEHALFLEKNVGDVQIILVSVNNECAKLGFDCNVTDFLQLPLLYSRFLQSIIRINNNEKLKHRRSTTAFDREDGFEGEANKDSIFIKLKANRYIHLRYDEIHYIASVENYATFVTDTEKHTINSSLVKLEHKLPKNIFIRVHRSYIINKNKLQAKDGNRLIFDLDKTHSSIPIGGTYTNTVMDHFDVLDV